MEDFSKGGPATIIDTGEYCTSLISHVIDYYLNEMNQDGFISDALEQYKASISSYQCPEDTDSYLDLDETFRLTMNDMGGIFLWHFVVVTVALMVAIISKYLHRHRGRSVLDEVRIGSDVEE